MPVPLCDKPVFRQGLCAKHLRRMERHGDVHGNEREHVVGSPAERWWSKVASNVETRCWEWHGQVLKGYGRFRVGEAMEYAHRVGYELLVGPVPEGLTIDHLCRNTRCVRPDHLEPVTLAENVRRASPFREASDREACANGHEMTPENSVPRAGRPGTFECRACRNARKRKHRLAAKTR